MAKVPAGLDKIPPLIPPLGDPLRSKALRFLGLRQNATDAEGLARLCEIFSFLTGNEESSAREAFFEQFYDPFVEPRDLPDEVSIAMVDPTPILLRLRDHPNLGAEQRELVERGLADKHFGLQLLANDPAFDHLLPSRRLTMETLRSPTSAERAMRRVLGRPILIVEDSAAAELVPLLESRMYREHCEEREHMSVDDAATELQRALDGEQPLALCVSADVRWQLPHWLALKSAAARTGDKRLKALIDKVERRFRSFDVGRPGRRKGSKNRPARLSVDQVEMRRLAPQLRKIIKDAQDVFKSGRNPVEEFQRAVDLVKAPPTAKSITAYCIVTRPLRMFIKTREEVVRWIVSRHLGVGVGAAKKLIKRSR